MNTPEVVLGNQSHPVHHFVVEEPLMSPMLLYIVAAIYLGVGLQYLQAGRLGMCLAFIAYALANIGFAVDVQ